jgi:hypothetical protein
MELPDEYPGPAAVKALVALARINNVMNKDWLGLYFNWPEDKQRASYGELKLMVTIHFFLDEEGI